MQHLAQHLVDGYFRKPCICAMFPCVHCAIFDKCPSQKDIYRLHSHNISMVAAIREHLHRLYILPAQVLNQQCVCMCAPSVIMLLCSYYV